MSSEQPKVPLDEHGYGKTAGKLFGNGCAKCNNQFFPKRAFCPDCLSTDTMEDFEIPGYGTLYTYTVIHTGSSNFSPPYMVGYVDINPQLRLFGHIRTADGRKPKINEQVRVKLGKIGQEDGQELWGVVLEPVPQ